MLSPEAWPQTPASIPARLPHRSYCVGCDSKRLEGSWLDMDVAIPRAKIATHARPRTANFSNNFFGVGVGEAPGNLCDNE